MKVIVENADEWKWSLEYHRRVVMESRTRQLVCSVKCEEIRKTFQKFLVQLMFARKNISVSTFLPGLSWRLMNQHQTTTEDSFCLLMMATCTFLLEMVEWLETHLGNMGMLRISKFSQSTNHVEANSLLRSSDLIQASALNLMLILILSKSRLCC